MANSNHKRKTTDAEFDKAKARGELPARPVITPVCWACGEPMVLSVSSPYGPGKIHPHCRAEAEHKADRIEMLRRWDERELAKRPYSAPYDFRDRNEAEDNSPARIGPEM